MNNEFKAGQKVVVKSNGTNSSPAGEFPGIFVKETKARYMVIFQGFERPCMKHAVTAAA